MRKRWRQLQATLDQVSQHLDQLERRAEKMETILMVREPATSAAADAYDGLRKQVVTAVTERLAHLAQLVQFDTALAHGADRDYLTRTASAWLEQASLARVCDARTDQDLLFELVEDLGGPLEVLEPAYVDLVTGRVIRPGQARRGARPAAPAQTGGELDAERPQATAAPAGEAGQ
jgi:hypothetical protein